MITFLSPINSYFVLLWFFIKRNCFSSKSNKKSEARGKIETINKRQELIWDYDAGLFQENIQQDNFLQRLISLLLCLNIYLRYMNIYLDIYSKKKTWDLVGTRKRSIFITGCHVFFAPDSHNEKDEMIFCCFNFFSHQKEKSKNISLVLISMHMRQEM